MSLGFGHFMKYLAFDIGEARIGLAVSDELGITCRPLFAVPAGNDLMQKLGPIFEEENPDVAVFGIPRHQSGDESAYAEQIREFAQGIKNEYNVQVEFEDESATTIEAERRLKEAGKNCQEIKELVDSESACVILESYLLSHNP